MTINPTYQAAIDDFRRMRRRASLLKIFRRFRKHASLLSYEDIRQQLRAVEKSNYQLKVIPLDAIQGSVGRYSDFTRDFLPTASVDPQRWARVKTQIYSQEGVPPIEVYQIGEVYFVLDGNHRVSVAREMGNSSIEAYVREVDTKVPLEVDDDVDELLIKTEYAEFLESTRFDQQYPEVDLMVSAPGCYTIMAQQIEAIHFVREFNANQAIPYEEALRYWYDTIYYPIVETIHQQNILAEYPDRTETDLFLWIFKHRAILAKELGWEISPNSAAKNLTRPSSKFKRLYEQSKHFLQSIINDQDFDTGPPPGTWRQEKMAAPEGRLFANIIVIIDGTENGWDAFLKGTLITELEGSQLYGLYISRYNRGISNREQQEIQAEFGQRCELYDIRGQLAFDVGSFEQIIKERACWADLVVISASENITLLQSLVHSCPTLLMITRNNRNNFKAILLVYDGSPKSQEALFLSAYLSTFWELPLFVVTIIKIGHDQVSSGTFVHAKEFLDYYGVLAKFWEIDQEPVENILNAAQDYGCDLIVLGGYNNTTKNNNQNRMLDGILEKSPHTLLICR